MIVVDDQHLFALITETESAELSAIAAGGVATTGAWFYRLSRAVHLGDGLGILSRGFAELSDGAGELVLARLSELPSSIQIIPQRRLVPAMVAIGGIRTANILTLEAVATAVLLNAPIFVSTQSTLLSEVAVALHVDIRVAGV